MARRGKNPKTRHESCRGGAVELRQPCWADYDDWAELRRESREYLTPWEPSWDTAHLTRPSFRARLANYKILISDDKAYPFHIFNGSTFVGACNITQIRRGSLQNFHIGYWVGERHTRNGYARAAIRSVLSFAFEDLGLHRAVAGVRSDNIASIKLLETCGFIFEGTAREFLKIDGVWVDHLIYSKLAHE